jgi:hypothetical protein
MNVSAGAKRLGRRRAQVSTPRIIPGSGGDGASPRSRVPP